MFRLPKRVILHLIRFFYQTFFIEYIIQQITINKLLSQLRDKNNSITGIVYFHTYACFVLLTKRLPPRFDSSNPIDFPQQQYTVMKNATSIEIASSSVYKTHQRIMASKRKRKRATGKRRKKEREYSFPGGRTKFAAGLCLP